MADAESYTITVSPDPLIGGGTADLEVTGPPGTTVTIEITGNNGDQETINVQLDAGGKGTAQWPVPTNWSSAEFILPDGTSDAVAIIQPV